MFTNSFVYCPSEVRRIGCFRDTGRRAVPQMDGRNPLVTGYYRRRKDAIAKCGLVAMKFGYRAFVVQHQGWCGTGPRAHVTYRKYGRSNRCKNGKGGPWANDVYVVHGRYLCLWFCLCLEFGAVRAVFTECRKNLCFL